MKALRSLKFGNGKLLDPEGHWQLTPPTTADLKAFYTTEHGNGAHGKGPLLLSTFPAAAGNIVAVVPPTVNIEYEASPRQIRLYVSDQRRNEARCRSSLVLDVAL